MSGPESTAPGSHHTRRVSRSPMRPPRAAATSPHRVVETSLGSTGYRVVGSGPPLALVTGFGVSVDNWPPTLLDHLARHRQVIAFDHPGIGVSAPTRGPLTIGAMADRIASTLVALRLDQVDLLGWSMGAMVAQHLMVRHARRIRRAVLASGAPGDGTAVRPTPVASVALGSGDPSVTVAALFPNSRVADARAYLADLRRYPSVTSVSADVRHSQSSAISAWRAGMDPTGRRVASTDIPSLVMGGADDMVSPIANARRLHELLRGSRLQVMEDAGHGFLFQAPDVVTRHVVAFLNS